MRRLAIVEIDVGIDWRDCGAGCPYLEHIQASLWHCSALFTYLSSRPEKTLPQRPNQCLSAERSE